MHPPIYINLVNTLTSEVITHAYFFFLCGQITQIDL